MPSLAPELIVDDATLIARLRVAEATASLEAATKRLDDLLAAKLENVVEVCLPTRDEELQVIGYRSTRSGDEFVAFQMGQAEPGPSFVYVHARCMASDVFGGLACGCGEGLRRARAEIRSRGRGLIIYRDPFRGRDLRHLGDSPAPVPGQERQIAAILRERGVSHVELNSNEPLDLDLLASAGLEITEGTFLGGDR